MDKFLTIVVAVVVGLGAVIVYSVIIALPVFCLWNWLVPAIFGLTKITFLQSCGLCFLCGILFGTCKVKN